MFNIHGVQVTTVCNLVASISYFGEAYYVSVIVFRIVEDKLSGDIYLYNLLKNQDHVPDWNIHEFGIFH